MKKLSETWFAEGYIDFELKKYTLLAYLQQINKYFNESKLYPQLADLIFHYNNIVAFRENKKYLQEQFPKKLTGVQLEKLQNLYEQMIEDDDLMQQLEEIIHFSAGAAFQHSLGVAADISVHRVFLPGVSALSPGSAAPLARLPGAAGLPRPAVCGPAVRPIPDYRKPDGAECVDIDADNGYCSVHAVGTRLALGASRWRLTRQVLVESIVLAGLGAWFLFVRDDAEDGAAYTVPALIGLQEDEAVARVEDRTCVLRRAPVMRRLRDVPV